MSEELLMTEEHLEPKIEHVLDSLRESASASGSTGHIELYAQLYLIAKGLAAERHEAGAVE